MSVCNLPGPNGRSLYKALCFSHFPLAFCFSIELSEEGILDDVLIVNKFIAPAKIFSQTGFLVPVEFKCTRRIEQRESLNGFIEQFLLSIWSCFK